MQHQVPQFIEIEDKIFGPLTFKQFIYVLGGGGLAFIIWTFVPRFIGLPLIGIVLSFAGALAFFKFNNKPFVEILEAALKYSINSKLYIWKKQPKKVEKKEEQEEEVVSYVPRLSDSKLRELAWSLDVHESINTQGEN